MDNDVCPWENAGDSDEEEWMFSSMKSYKHLLIYSLSGLPELLAVSECGRLLAVAGRSSEASSELVTYQLPAKLLARTQEEAGLASGRDFKILAGAVVEEHLSGLLFLPDSSGLVTTSSGRPGCKLWTLQPGQDELKLEQSAASSIIPTRFFVTQTHAYLTDGNAVDEIKLATAEVTNTWLLNNNNIGGCVDPVEDMHLSEKTSCLHLAFGSGLYSQLDMASGEIRTVNVDIAEAGTSRWSIKFENSRKKEGSLNLFALSSQGVLKVFDTSSVDRPVITSKIESDTPSTSKKSLFEVSLAQNRLLVNSCESVHVYCFDLNKGCISLDFKHEGHKSKKRQVRVLAARVHPHIDKLVFTTDSEKNIHAWQYDV